ncbi:MAG: hypothetical protein AAF488_09610 [Planctomycetota bacterium]
MTEAAAGEPVRPDAELARAVRRADTKLRVDDSERDLGEALRGGALTLEVILENSGEVDRTLRVRGSCGCITVKAPVTVAAGETVAIALTVETGRLLPGVHRKSVLLTTDDPVRPRIKIPLTWRVRGLMEPTAGSRLSVRGVHHSIVRGTLELRPGSELADEVTAARSVQGRFTVLDYEVDGSVLRVAVAVPAAAKALRTTDLLALDVRCSDGQVRRCDLPVDIELLERIGFRPARNVAFRRSETRRFLTGRQVERRIHLKANDPAIRFDVKEFNVEGDGEAFRVAMKPIQPGEEYAFSIQLVKYLDRKVARARLVIYTTDPKEPIKRLPLHAQFEPNGPTGR